MVMYRKHPKIEEEEKVIRNRNYGIPEPSPENHIQST